MIALKYQDLRKIQRVFDVKQRFESQSQSLLQEN